MLHIWILLFKKHIIIFKINIWLYDSAMYIDILMLVNNKIKHAVINIMF